ncbi:hypothetical protein [Kitasatospora sp. NPDC059571]|uniref:hypothetical protein n=1 Tax=Kitasatospora sp. NPDC059571 TaxID=3346871 RepID=UPI0036757411
MRGVGIPRTAMRLAAAGRRHLSRWSVPAVLLSAAGLPLLGWWLVGPDLAARGATLGILAAGWWGLGLVPVHSDPSRTGPARRTRTVRPPADPAGAPAAQPLWSRSR